MRKKLTKKEYSKSVIYIAETVDSDANCVTVDLYETTHLHPNHQSQLYIVNSYIFLSAQA